MPYGLVRIKLPGGRLRVRTHDPSLLVFVFAGQSNMSGYSPIGTLQGSGLVTNPGSPGTAPNYVPGYQQTAANEWTGAPPVSITSGTQYPYPTDANSPCLYNECVAGQMDHVFDSWGSHVKQFGQFNSSGALGDGGSYGLELSFLQSHLATYPEIPIAGIKQSLGGTSLAADWLPANTGSNSTGSDKLQFSILRTMMSQAAARLNATGRPWKWGAFVWMQGESGAHTWQGFTSDGTYLADARGMFAVVRSLTRSDLPIVVGRIGDNWINTNPYLIAAGNGYTSIDYSITSALGTVNSTTRANALAGANARRSTQATLGLDTNCVMFSNDGYPTRPPLSLTAATNDSTGYHWGGPGNLAAGESAFAAYQTVRN